LDHLFVKREFVCLFLIERRTTTIYKRQLETHSEEKTRGRPAAMIWTAHGAVILYGEDLG
jgi:hypothetical protein